MVDPKPLTRRELSQFLPDQRSVRAFEELFKLLPSEIEVNVSETADSNSRSNQNTELALQALGQASSANVLLWLSIP